MIKRHRLAIVSIFLGGIVGILLVFLLSSNVTTTRASRVRDTSSTPDLVINMGVGDESVLANEVISYVLAYTNTLDQQLDNVIISSTISSDQYYTPAVFLSDPIVSTDNFTHSGNFHDGYKLHWQLGSLAAGEGGWIVVTTTLPPEAEPSWRDKWPLLGMSAVITTSTPGVSSGNPQGLDGDSASVTVVGPVLKISKSDDPEEVRPGRLLTYTLTVENKDREDVIAAHGLVITDTLPENTVFQYASGTGAYSSTSPSSGLVIWHPPDPLEKDAEMAVHFTVRLTASMPSCPDKIRNEDYSVSANETIREVTGGTKKTKIDDVLEKTVETPDPPPADWGTEQVFPGGIITYTVSVYNPLYDQILEGVRLTDTMPGPPNPFNYQNMVGEGPTPITTTPHVVWDDLSLSAGGVSTFSFRAQVPYHIYIPPNKDSETYENNLAASAPGLVICDMDDHGPSNVKVLRQIELSKDVAPDSVLSGETVVYTITMENVSETTITDIRLTDTLPADFYYVEMISGPEPEAGYQHKTVVWDDLGVAGEDVTTLSFRAVVSGWPDCYKNSLSASSPWTTIPDRTKEAEVCIRAPIVIHKSVGPSSTFVEQTVLYNVSVCNVASDTYTIDQFKDFLPDGFYVDGANPYVYDVPTPVDLAPDECWEHGFEADVTIDVGCGNLPKEYKNNRAQVHVVDVGDVYREDLAPLQVVPNVRMEKTANHETVVPGETFVYTVTLDNDSSIQVGDVTIVDTLPGDESVYFEYEEMVAGDAPDDYTDHTLEWRDQTIPADGQLVLVYRVRVPQNMPLSGWGQYKNEAEVTTTDLVCIESPADVRVKVVDEIIEKVSKKADPEEVDPWGLVKYEIQLDNADSVPVTGVNVTDTLPSLLTQNFVYSDTEPGYPEPDEVNGQQVIWRDLSVPPDGLELHFNVRAAILYGNYDNAISASCPRSPITPDEDDIEATVKVLPGVILYKTVSPTQTKSGWSVVYTVKLNNQSQGTLADVRITDTLPTGFSYRRNIEGPVPVQRSPVVVWEVEELSDGESQGFVFEVEVGSEVITGTYSNKVEATSPSALIPDVEEGAPVEVMRVELDYVYLPLLLRNCEP